MLHNTIVLPLLHELNRCATCIIEGQSIGAEELNQHLADPAYKPTQMISNVFQSVNVSMD